MSKVQKVMCQNFTFVSTFLSPEFESSGFTLVDVAVDGFRRCDLFSSLYFAGVAVVV